MGCYVCDKIQGLEKVGFIHLCKWHQPEPTPIKATLTHAKNSRLPSGLWCDNFGPKDQIVTMWSMVDCFQCLRNGLLAKDPFYQHIFSRLEELGFYSPDLILAKTYHAFEKSFVVWCGKDWEKIKSDNESVVTDWDRTTCIQCLKKGGRS